MIPPTSIDGTDITGATIDGTDVQEITVDGQTVFSAGPTLVTPPVAASDLIGWYTFENSAMTDFTAVFGVGDTNDYSGSLNGNSINSSGGVTDQSSGANSGVLDLGGSSNEANIDSLPFPTSNQNYTVCAWFNLNQSSSGFGESCFWDFRNPASFTNLGDKDGGLNYKFGNNGFNITISRPPTSQWWHAAMTADNSTGTAYFNGSSVGSRSISTRQLSGFNAIGLTGIDMFCDDLRIYDRELSSSEINQIYQNTEP